MAYYCNHRPFIPIWVILDRNRSECGSLRLSNGPKILFSCNGRAVIAFHMRKRYWINIVYFNFTEQVVCYIKSILHKTTVALKGHHNIYFFNYMKNVDVYMQDNYVYMQDNYVHMQDNYVYITTYFFHTRQILFLQLNNFCSDVPSWPPY